MGTTAHRGICSDFEAGREENGLQFYNSQFTFAILHSPHRDKFAYADPDPDIGGLTVYLTNMLLV